MNIIDRTLCAVALTHYESQVNWTLPFTCDCLSLVCRLCGVRVYFSVRNNEHTLKENSSIDFIMLAVISNESSWCRSFRRWHYACYANHSTLFWLNSREMSDDAKAIELWPKATLSTATATNMWANRLTRKLITLAKTLANFLLLFNITPVDVYLRFELAADKAIKKWLRWFKLNVWQIKT